MLPVRFKSRLRVLFTPELFCFVPGRTFRSESLRIFLLVRFVFTMDCCKADHSAILHCGAASWQQQHKQLNLQRWWNASTFGKRNQMPETTKKSSGVYKVVSEQTKERRYKRSVEQCSAKAAIHKRYEAILSIVTSYLLAPVARQSISRLFVPVAGSVAFTLQTNRYRVQMELGRDHLF